MDCTKKELAALTGLSENRIYEIDKQLRKNGEEGLFQKSEGTNKCDLAFFVRRWAAYNAEKPRSDGMTKKELAALTGLTYQRVFQIDKALRQNGGESLFAPMTGDERDRYDPGVFVRRWVEFSVNRATADDQDLEAVKARHEAVKMEKTQLEVDRMKGILVDVQDVRRLWGDIADTIMQGMLRLPSTLAPMMRGLENIDMIRSIADMEIRKTLEILSDTPLPDYLLAQEDEEGTEPEE